MPVGPQRFLHSPSPAILLSSVLNSKFEPSPWRIDDLLAWLAPTPDRFQHAGFPTMMSSLRRGASSWFIKAFLAILVSSFVLWGVADVFKGYGTRAVATVAGREISPEQFQQAFDGDFQRLQQQYGQGITREMARKFGLEQQALSRLVSEAVLDVHAKELQLGLSDQAIMDTIKQDPSFQGANGEFSRDVFANLLRANGMTEQRFFATQRLAQVRGQIATGTQAGQAAPAASINAQNRFRNETRVVSLVTIPPEKIADIAEPDEAKLKAHHETNKGQYSAPEYRKLALMTLNPDTFKKPDLVTEDDVKAAYEPRKASFGTPEKRTLQMLSFKDAAAAEKALKDLKGGKDFVALGKELGLKESDILLGVQTKAGMIDKAIAEAAFSLKKLEISKPVAGTFSTVLVRATEITPAVEKTYDQVKGEIREGLAREKALGEAQAIQDKIENSRSRGASLKELAEKHGLKLQEVVAIDQEGRGPDSKPVTDIAGAARLLPKAFVTDVGVEAEGVDLQDGMVSWFEVQAITPSVLRPFDAVKEQVKTDWTAMERRKGVQELAQKLVERASKGETLDVLAKELGQKITVLKPIKRQDKADGVSPAGVNLAFSLAQGAVAQADTGAGGRALIRVDGIAAEMTRQMTEDLANQYMAALQTRYDVKVNRDALERAAGRAPQ
jgi:peptidyl-prolyl cis-trans isomerase D